MKSYAYPQFPRTLGSGLNLRVLIKQQFLEDFGSSTGDYSSWLNDRKFLEENVEDFPCLDALDGEVLLHLDDLDRV